MASEAAERIIVALDRRHPRAALGEGVLELLLLTGGGILSQSGWDVARPEQRVR